MISDVLCAAIDDLEYYEDHTHVATKPWRRRCRQSQQSCRPSSDTLITLQFQTPGRPNYFEKVDGLRERLSGD